MLGRSTHGVGHPRLRCLRAHLALSWLPPPRRAPVMTRHMMARAPSPGGLSHAAIGRSLLGARAGSCLCLYASPRGRCAMRLALRHAQTHGRTGDHTHTNHYYRHATHDHNRQTMATNPQTMFLKPCPDPRPPDSPYDKDFLRPAGMRACGGAWLCGAKRAGAPWALCDPL